MRKIAGQIAYSPTTIYHYFRGKAELVLCILEDYHARLIACLEKIGERGDDPLVTLRNGMRCCAEFGLAHPSYYRLAFMGPPLPGAEFCPARGAKAAELFQRLRDRVEACIRGGLLRTMEADLAAQILWTVTHGVTAHLISNPGLPWAEREALLDGAIDCAIDGLRPAR
jgi:AcrR family transcriptional regulator